LNAKHIGRSTEVFSIFGETEAVVANAMVTEGKLRRILSHDIPPTARFCNGRLAQFAVIVPREYLGEFEDRIEQLRA
jgi:hypothetical protein